MKLKLRAVVSSAISVMAAIGLVVFATQYQACKTDQSVRVPSEQKAPVESVGCLGRIEPEHGIIRISARSISGQPSIVADLRVEENDEVRKGQLLAVLDSRQQLEAAWRSAEARIKVQEKRLEQVQAGAKTGDVSAREAEIARTESELAHAESELRRYELLHNKQVVPRSALDTHRQRVDTLRQTLRQQKESLKSFSEVRGVDVDLARAELESATRDALRARSEFERSMIYSPINGLVLQIHARTGEQVGSAGLMELGSKDRINVIAEVPEEQISRVRTGQRAKVTGAGLTTTLGGVVTRIGSKVARNRDLPVDPGAFSDMRVIEVTILLDEPERAARLINAQVTVVIGP